MWLTDAEALPDPSFFISAEIFPVLPLLSEALPETYPLVVVPSSPPQEIVTPASALTFPMGAILCIGLHGWLDGEKIALWKFLVSILDVSAHIGLEYASKPTESKFTSKDIVSSYGKIG